MKYVSGYVAFVDVLGFSNYVKKEDNSQNVADLFDFIRKLQYLFNSSPEMKVKVALFSDTLIFSTVQDESLTMMLLALLIGESYLREHTGLFFRGAVVKGLFYHEEDIAFGPAIISAHELEGQAKFSRILFDENVLSDNNETGFTIFKDFDGHLCFNPYAIRVSDHTSEGGMPSKEEMVNSMRKERDLLCKTIKENYETSVADKYLWRIIPFNRICDTIATIYQELGYQYTETDAKTWETLKISIHEFTAQ